MQREQPAVPGGGRRASERADGCFWFRADRKCGDRKFSLGRIIDRAKDVQSEHARSSDKLCGTRSINRRRPSVRRLLLSLLAPSPFLPILRVSSSLFNFPSRRSRVIEKQARKLCQLCGNYFPRYCHRPCALLNNSLLYVHSVNV